LRSTEAQKRINPILILRRRKRIYITQWLIKWWTESRISASRKRHRNEKRRNCTKYGYYTLLTIRASDVRDHLSDREVSTVLFLPAK
jgi:hypothetical protein